MTNKKVNREDKTFFRFMTIIGIIVIGGLGYAFLDAAPSMPPSKIHFNATQPKDCLNCHVENLNDAPIMPHRPMLSCISCHSKRTT
tara:strand:- start:947 stop:1204 length:258 start_codon:yes stop_codon:yes gene_type:complete